MTFNYGMTQIENQTMVSPLNGVWNPWAQAELDDLYHRRAIACSDPELPNTGMSAPRKQASDHWVDFGSCNNIARQPHSLAIGWVEIDLTKPR